MNEFSYLLLFGGLSFFIFGIRLTRLGLQEVSEDRLRSLINSVTRNHYSALFAGVLISSVLQSSSATTVMLVGFANTGLISLVQAMAVILGADIGTTITVQIISFRLANWSLVFVVLGVLLGILRKETRLSHIGNVILGFGLVFYGMNLMREASLPLQDSVKFQTFLSLVSDTPIFSLVAAAIFTALVHSSAATIGVILSFAQAGSMTLELAIAMVLGANIGTCFPALLAGQITGYQGRRVAFAHLTFKLIGAFLVFPFIAYFADFCRVVSDFFIFGTSNIVRQIANAHTIFNLAISILFLPFITYGAKVLEKALPKPQEGERKERFEAKFLDKNAIDTPALAQGCVTREIHRTAGIVFDMFKSSMEMFKKPSEELFEHIEEMDDRVDYLDRKIRFYLAKISRQTLTEEQADRQIHLLTIITNLEFIGDTINRDLVKLARKMVKNKISFSEEGWQEIQNFHQKVQENFNFALCAFADRNEELARKVLRNERNLGELEVQLKQNHLARLQAGLQESFDTSSIHLEFLAELRRINNLLTHFAYSVINLEEFED